MARLLSILILSIAGGPAQAQSPENTVRWIYESIGQPAYRPAESGLRSLRAPERGTQFFTRRMLQFFAANDSHGGDLTSACIDFGLEIPGTDFDGAEVLRTLSLSRDTAEARISVTAAFSNFGRREQVVYDFVVEDGLWKIDDIAGAGYRVSQIPCAARDMPGTGASYCYRSDSDSLRLTVLPGGGASFFVESWQANGHSCKGQGSARAIAGGWEYQGQGACRLQFLTTAGQGLRLADRDWACKTQMCGQRAVLDAVTFQRSSQIDCRHFVEPRY